MKNIKTILLMCCLFFSGQTMAQEAHEKGDLTINAGISFGVIGYGYGYGSAGFPIPLTASVEYGISDLVSVGPYAGYMSRSYGMGSDLKFTALSFGGQMSFHLTPLLNELNLDINSEKVDYYGKLILGYETYSWKFNGQSYMNGLYGTNSGRMIFGPVVGVRYLFSPNVGVYFEGGRGAFGYLNLGLSLKI